jgi:hypothetical protein
MCSIARHADGRGRGRTVRWRKARRPACVTRRRVGCQPGAVPAERDAGHRQPQLPWAASPRASIRATRVRTTRSGETSGRARSAGSCRVRGRRKALHVSNCSPYPCLLPFRHRRTAARHARSLARRLGSIYETPVRRPAFHGVRRSRQVVDEFKRRAVLSSKCKSMDPIDLCRKRVRSGCREWNGATPRERGCAPRTIRWRDARQGDA